MSGGLVGRVESSRPDIALPVGPRRLDPTYAVLRGFFASDRSSRSNSFASDRRNPGSTSPPSRVPDSPSVVFDFDGVYTTAVRFRGSITQVSRTPTGKYSRTFRTYSPRVLPTPTTSMHNS